MAIFKDTTDGYIQIFKHGDVLHYYSNWARDWYNNSGFSTSFFRPQLWSANIAVLYHFIGTEYIEIFSKNIFNILIFYFIFISVSAAIITGNFLYFILGIIGTYHCVTSTFNQGTSGYMEIPLGVTFAIFLLILKEINLKIIDNKKIIYLLIICSISFILLTKELGWIFLPFFLIYIFWFNNFNKSLDFTFKDKIYILLISFIIFIIFYIGLVYNQPDLFSFNNPVFKLLLFDEKTHLIAGHGVEYLDLKLRLKSAIAKLPNFIMIPLIINAFGIILKEHKYLKLFRIFLVFYILIWASLISNEVRYVYPIIFLSWLLLADILLRILTKIKPKFYIYLVLLTSILFIFFSTNIPSRFDILDKTSQKKINILDKDLREPTKIFFNFLKENPEYTNVETDVYLLDVIGFNELKDINIKYLRNSEDLINKSKLDKSNKKIFFYRSDCDLTNNLEIIYNKFQICILRNN